MAIELCPLADEVGNLADWAAVIVAAVGALAVIMLSRAANRTAGASLDLAQQLKAREDDLHAREVRLIARELLREANVVLADVQSIQADLRAGKALTDWGGPNGVGVAMSVLSVPTMDEHVDRLKLLPYEVAAAVSDARRLVKELVEASTIFNDQYRPYVNAEEFVPVLIAKVNHTEEALRRSFLTLRNVLEKAAPPRP